MPTVILPTNIESTKRKIQALESIIPYDNAKDREIHERALASLKEYEEKLLMRDKMIMKLNQIAKGALEEQFEAEFRTLLKNIADPNTDPKKARKITITLTIKPNEKRNIADMSFQTKAILIPSMAIEFNIYIEKDKMVKWWHKNSTDKYQGKLL